MTAALPSWREKAIVIPCAGDHLVGIVTEPANANGQAVVILPGGPQYRAGAHRQNVLLARALADKGVSVLRFDCRGMGDSSGDHPGFSQTMDDLAAAIMAIRAATKATRQTFIAGLCDGATAAALFTASAPPREAAIDGLILLNPWARSERTRAAALTRAYYPRRLVAWEAWRKLLQGKLGLRTVASEFLSGFRQARSPEAAGDDLPRRLEANLSRSTCPTLIVLAGLDLTAAEFDMAVLSSPRLRRQSGVTVTRLPEADHTFTARPAWGHAVASIQDWLDRQRTALPGA